jgi:hypothetical protein
VKGPEATTAESAPKAGADAALRAMGGGTAAMMRRATRQCPLGFWPWTHTICPGNKLKRGRSRSSSRTRMPLEVAMEPERRGRFGLGWNRLIQHLILFFVLVIFVLRWVVLHALRVGLFVHGVSGAEEEKKTQTRGGGKQMNTGGEEGMGMNFGGAPHLRAARTLR